MYVLDLETMRGADERVAWVKDRTGGRGADIAFNCANSPAFIESLKMCRPGGRAVCIGVSGGPPLQLEPDLLFEQISIKTVVMAEARHFYEAVNFLATRQRDFPFEKLLSNTYPLERVTDALRGMANYTETKPVILANG